MCVCVRACVVCGVTKQDEAGVFSFFLTSVFKFRFCISAVDTVSLNISEPITREIHVDTF